ncbi:MAG: FAD-binding protein [Desulfobacteraceae bacterium]|jgi:succinate dehydrogenase / fumarate reductase flavoprotein subunit
MRNSFQIASSVNCDVLIIGAGGAGLRCAAEIFEKRPEARVVAVTKVGHPQKSHTNTAQGGLAAVDPRDPIDKPLYHMFDTWKGSDCSADQNVIKKIVESAWDQVVWLENHGMHFSRDQEGRVGKRTFGGHTIGFGEASAFRAVFEADRTGKGIMDTVWGEALKGDISFLSQAIATELLFKGDRCVGAVIFRQKEGEFVAVLSKVTVLATGGNGQLFKVTTNCRQNTGDGLAIILKAGLPIMDPEAIQFHPTGIVGPGILASETLRSVGGILRNKDLEAFMERYAPKMKELAPRDLVARAMETEIREGRGALNPDHKLEHVWIDLRHLSEYIHDVQIPEVTSFFRKFVNLDPKKALCPVRPSNHYQMGGIPTNEFGEVVKGSDGAIPGLFAVGECAAASFHGFNRLGTNSLLELITMGKFAGERAIEYLEDADVEPPSETGEMSFSQFSAFMEGEGKDNFGGIRKEMQSLMTEKVGVFRTESGLHEAIEGLKALKERADQVPLSSRTLTMNQELIQRWELDNLLNISMVTAQAALNRRESRGGHYREDFPERTDEFDYHTLASVKAFGEVNFDKRGIDMSLYEAKGEHYERFGMIERKY